MLFLIYVIFVVFLGCKFICHAIFDTSITDFLLNIITGYALLITLLFTNLAISVITLVHRLYEGTDIIAEESRLMRSMQCINPTENM